MLFPYPSLAPSLTRKALGKTRSAVTREAETSPSLSPSLRRKVRTTHTVYTHNVLIELFQLSTTCIYPMDLFYSDTYIVNLYLREPIFLGKVTASGSCIVLLCLFVLSLSF